MPQRTWEEKPVAQLLHNPKQTNLIAKILINAFFLQHELSAPSHVPRSTPDILRMIFFFYIS